VLNPNTPPPSAVDYNAIYAHTPEYCEHDPHTMVMAHSPDAAVRLINPRGDGTYGHPRVMIGRIDTSHFYTQYDQTLQLTRHVIFPDTLDNFPDNVHTPAPNTLLYEFGLQAAHMNINYEDGIDISDNVSPQNTTLIPNAMSLEKVTSLVCDFPSLIAPDQTITFGAGRNKHHELLHLTVLPGGTHLKLDYELQGKFPDRLAYVCDMETLRRPFPLGETLDAAYAYARQIHRAQTQYEPPRQAHNKAKQAALRFKPHPHMTDDVDAWFNTAHNQIAGDAGKWANIITVQETLMR
jgi:hypothetical protein